MRRLLAFVRARLAADWCWFRGLRRRWRVALVAAFTVIVAVMSVGGYKGYMYVEHDNEFCTSCHLMSDAFNRFQRSAHSRIECHDCHKSTRLDQAYQLYATIFERPTEVNRHARVPNEVCGACHVRGDPQRWRQVAATVGHRVHLESRDSSLRDLQCVTCHSVGVHEFASADRTCGQAGCHTNTRIHLGQMGAVEMHCTTCHAFMAEARGLALDSLGRPMTPQAAECLQCHQMRSRIGQLEIAHDPHRGSCGDCHNPHEQTTAREVSCASTRCHADWRTVSYHLGVPRPEECLRCHQPHSWRVEGANCLRCHKDIERERPARRGGTAVSAEEAEGLMRLASFAGFAPSQTQAPARRQRVFASFSHGSHRNQRCADCHSSTVRHGALMVRTERDCQRCHHVGPTREDCLACHTRNRIGRNTTPRTHTIQLTANRATVTRRLRFDHAIHDSLACLECHTNPVSRAPDRGDCASCHAPHHSATANCLTCHAQANALATHRAADHATCASTDCHGERAAGLPTSRVACLVCHQNQQNHQPGRLCERCHRVTERPA